MNIKEISIKDTLKKAVCHIGMFFKYMGLAILVSFYRLYLLIKKLAEKNVMATICLLAVIFFAFHISVVGIYRSALDKCSKKSYNDSERIYRLQNDSIALRNLKSKHDTVYLKKTVVINKTKKDTI